MEKSNQNDDSFKIRGDEINIYRGGILDAYEDVNGGG